MQIQTEQFLPLIVWGDWEKMVQLRRLEKKGLSKKCDLLPGKKCQEMLLQKEGNNIHGIFMHSSLFDLTIIPPPPAKGSEKCDPYFRQWFLSLFLFTSLFLSYVSFSFFFSLSLFLSHNFSYLKKEKEKSRSLLICAF